MTEPTETTAAPTETPETPAAGGEPTRDDYIKAVREAGGTESVDTAAEALAAGADPAAEAAKAAEQATQTEEEPRIAGILRAREKAAAEREAARNHAEELISRARQESERMMSEAREQARRELDAERERLRTEFRSNPTATLRTLGTPEEINAAVLREGTPEWTKIRQLESELAETKKQAGEVGDVRQQFEQFKQEQAKQAYETQVAHVRNAFLTEANTEKAPFLNARYEPDEIFQKADALALQWKKGGLELNKDFAYSDLVQYLERDAKKKIQPLFSSSTPVHQVSAGAPEKEPGNAPKVPANGPRTLSAAQGSERRTSPKPLHEMSTEDQRKALIEEVAAARRANPGAEM